MGHQERHRTGNVAYTLWRLVEDALQHDLARSSEESLLLLAVSYLCLWDLLTAAVHVPLLPCSRKMPRMTDVRMLKMVTLRTRRSMMRVNKKPRRTKNVKKGKNDLALSWQSRFALTQFGEGVWTSRISQLASFTCLFPYRLNMATAVALATQASAIDAILSRKLSDQPQFNFSFTPFLRSNGLAALVSTVPVCEAYASGSCPLGRRCPNRHPTPSQQPTHHFGRQNDNYVCKHWLKGLCKKGDACDYLHEYNLRKMTECQHYNQHGYCQNGDECLYVHVKEDSKLPMCEDYNKGFCEKGPRCGKRHVRRQICLFYMAGFCPDGPNCKHGVHLKSGQAGKEAEEEKQRKERVAELERREEEQRREYGWKNKKGRGGGGGRWKDKRDRDRDRR